MTTTTDINPALRSSFERDGDQLARTLSFQDAAFTTWVMANERDADPLSAWWRAYLQGETPATTGQVQPVRTAELFCGSGGLAQGFRQAALEVGLQPQSVAARMQLIQALKQVLSGDLSIPTSTDLVSDFHLF